jgi:branched-chain amino acid transport system ATP-binding protein
MALLEVSAISLSFSGLRALANVSFNVGSNEIVGLIGPNGAGKTTLLNCVSGLYRPDRGQIYFEGTDLTKLKAYEVAARGIRRTFQNLELFRETTTRENIVLGLMYRHRTSLWNELFAMPASRAKQRTALDEADAIINLHGLHGVANVLVSEMSYGMQKSVELARALAGQPKLLLLDEPAAGMNPEESRRIAEAVRDLRDRTGIAVLLIEHDMRVVMTICDRIVVLDHGEKIGEGSPAQIRQSPAVVKAYLGEDTDNA